MSRTEKQKENIRTWLAALRSGEYGQAKYTLETKNPDGSFSYCCLGVACKIGLLRPQGVMEEAIIPTWSSMNESFGIRFQPYIASLGLSVTVLNDRGYTFEQIADLIEKEYL